jgi:hypothetical protein
MTDVNAENVTQDNDDAFFDSVIADIDKTAAQVTSDDIDLDHEDSNESQDNKSTPDATPQIKRKNQNRAQERIQQVIAQRDLVESKYQAAVERLNLANEKISLLESQISSYEPVIKEFNDFKASFMETGEIPNNLTKPSLVDTTKPLTAADIDRLFEEREAKKNQEASKRKELEALEKENLQILTVWKPHLKKLEDPAIPAEHKAAFERFIASAKENVQRRELIKVLGKYDNATEIIYGLSKKQGFDSMPLVEQVEMAFKLDNKISQHKQKTTTSAATGIDSKMRKDSNAPGSYAEYVAKKNGRK